jgi:MATE family multidrug resistance protein
MNVVDTWLAGAHGSVTLAAVGVGTATWSLVLLACIGVLMAVPPMVSQLNGEQRRGEIAPVFRQSLWLAAAMGVSLFGLLQLAPAFYAAIGIAAEVQPEASAFLRAIAWGAPALAGYFACRYVSEGVAYTRPTMWFGFAGLAALVPLGAVLMFGFGPLPALGAAGLGYATALVLWGQLIGMLVFLARSHRYADLRLFARFEGPRWSLLHELLRIGLPMGVAIFMEGSLFVATALIIGTLGAVEVAAHQIAILVASICFMVPLGVAMATTVRVGHAMGAGDPSGVRWAAAAGLGIVLLTQTLGALLLLFGAGMIAAFFSDDAAVRSLAVLLMLYAAVFQYPDGLQALANGALRGLKDTRVPMFITVLAYWALGLSLGAGLGLGLGWGAPGLWAGLILGLLAAAALLSWRFLRLARSDARLLALRR